MTKARILIVEDEAIVAENIRTHLNSLGYAVSAVVSSGEEAIQKAEETRPDLVLMDIKLEGDMDGVEAARQIRARFDIPMIYLTAYADEDTLQRAKLTKPFGYILKPFEVRELQTSIEVALYKHKAEGTLRQYAEEQAALYAITSAAVASLDPDELLSTVFDVMLPLLDSDAGWVSLPGLTLDDPPRVVAWRGVPESFVATEMAIPLRDCPLCASLLAYGDVQSEPQLIVGCPRLSPEALASVNLHSHVCIPLSAGNKVLGILDIAWHTPRPCTESDRALLAAIGQQVGMALYNAQLYQAARQVDRLQALNELDQALVATLDPKTAVEVTLQHIAAALGTPTGALFVLPPQASTHRVQVFTLGRGWTDRVASEEEAQWLQAFSRQFQNGREAISLSGNDLAAISGHLELAQRWSPNGLVVPIRSEGRLVAVLAIGSRPTDRPFTDEDRALAQAAAGRAGMAIENARLYQSERKRAVQLAAVNQVARRAASILDLDQLLHEVVTAIQRSFNYHHVGLFLLDKVSGELKLRAIAGGFADTPPLDHRLALGKGMAGWAAKTGQPLLANDVSQEPRYVLGILGEALTKAELCVPLKLAGQVIGVLDIQSTQLDAFDETDLMAMETLADQLAVAIENARLYQKTAQRLKVAETLSAVTTALTRSLDLDQVLQSIMDSAARLIPASTSGVIHLADEATGKLIPRATFPGINVQESMEMPIGKGIAGLVMREKQLINVPNVELDPRFLPLDTDTPKKSLLTAPLMIDGDCIGTLSLNSDKVGAFSADDGRLLATLADQATIAVRNARLHQEVRHRVEELVSLNRVSRTVTSSLDMEQVLTTVIQEATDVLKVEAASVMLLDDKDEELVFETAVGPWAGKVKGLRFPLGQGIAGWVAREGQRLLVPDVREDPRFYPRIDEVSGCVTRSVLAVPLKVKGRVIGVIEAVNKTGGDFSEADVALLSSMAQSAAIAIENARLFEQAQWEIAERKRAEEALRRRNEELVALNAIATTIGQSLDLNHILNATLDKVLEMIESDAGWIQLLDEDAGTLSLVAHRGFSPGKAEEAKTIKLGESITGEVIQSGQPIVVDKVSDAPRLRMKTGRPCPEPEGQEALHAFAGVPIKAKDKVLGVLGVCSRSPRQPGSQETQLLIAIGHQIGIAIENVRLAEKASEIEILRELNHLRSELIANVSHELRTPLGLIKIFCSSLLMEDVDFERETQLKFLHHIDEEADSLERIVDNLLDLSRMESGRLHLDKVPTDMGQLAREVIEVTKLEIDGQPTQHCFVCDFPPNPLVANVDPNRIEQVLRNLLSNAIKYSPGGGTITVQGRGDKRQLLIRVRDQGIGISPKDLERVFERFYRVENELTQRMRGAGLGLPVCKGIVEAHGGRIWVESTLGVGSIFYFTLPVGDRSE